MDVGEGYRQLRDDEVVQPEDERIYTDIPEIYWEPAALSDWVGKTVGQWDAAVGPVVVRRKLSHTAATIPPAMITRETMIKAEELAIASESESDDTAKYWLALATLVDAMWRQGRDLFSADVTQIVEYEHRQLVESKTIYREPNILTDYNMEVEVCDEWNVWTTGILIGQHSSPAVPEEKWLVYFKGHEGLSGGRTAFMFPHARIVVRREQ